jgi:hypothetical protein
MKSGKLFWGVFFLTTGVVLMLDKLEWISIDLPGIGRYWPVAIVLLGVGVLVAQRWAKLAFAGAAGAFLGLLIGAVFSTHWGDWAADREMQVQHYTEGIEQGTREARLSLDAGAGVFRIEDTTGALITADAQSQIGYEFSSEKSDSSQDVQMRMEKAHRHWPFGRWENRVSVRLHPVPMWDLDMDVGAAQVEFDLRPFKVRTLHIDAGATSLNVKLGTRTPSTDVVINAGASSIHLEVPESAGCAVYADAPLSSKSFSGFSKVSKGKYTTDNYETAAQKITIHIDAGVSSLKVRRVNS